VAEFLIYGATGYTGRLVAEHAVSIGLQPVLAGRDAKTLRSLAARLGLECRVFGLDEPARLRSGLEGMAAVLHAAGPFSATSKPMADACIDVGAHYCDITGEIDVFEALAARGAEARRANVMLLPGAGFDVVPSDCLAAHVVARLRGATRLRLSIGGLTEVSRGTAKTMVEGIARGVLVRSGGRIVERRHTPRAEADFGRGSRQTIGVSWGDVSTAWHSTGVADIEVFFEATRDIERAAAMPEVLRRVFAFGLTRRLINAQIDKRMPPGPSSDQRACARAIIVAEAWSAAGVSVSSRIETPEAYTLTAATALEVVRRAASGSAVRFPDALDRLRGGLHPRVRGRDPVRHPVKPFS
jgi:short subunit dehydrogenase-like uncharacterized protein